MANLGLTWIIVAVVLTGASQADAYCESVEVKEASISRANGIYTEQYGLTCDSSRFVYQQGQKFLYHNNGYWMISEYYLCLDGIDRVRVWARVLDSAMRPELITNYWEEWFSNGWFPNEYLEVDCFRENDGGLSTGTVIAISLATVFGVVVVISIVTRLVKSCKVRAATRQTIPASSTTTRSVSNSYVTPQTNSTLESYQGPAYEHPGYINPHFEPDSPGVQSTSPMYEFIPHEDVPPPPSYEEAVNNHKQISTISNMEPPPLYNAACPTDGASRTAQALSAYPPSENQSFYPPPSTGDAELSTETAVS